MFRNVDWTIFFFAGNETLLCSDSLQRFSLPQFLSLYRTEGGREDGRKKRKESGELSPSFEVWEVKITGTASRLNHRFLSSAESKSPQLGPACVIAP